MASPITLDASISPMVEVHVDVPPVHHPMGDNTTENFSVANSPIATISFIPEAPIELTPMIGQEFKNEEEVYSFYNSYAKWCGFSIRKSQTRRSKDGDICSRILRCSKEGLRHKNEDAQRKRRERSVTRCECLASVTVKVVANSTTWRVMSFNKEHTHKLESPRKSRCLRSHRKVSESQLDIAEGLHKVGIGISRSLDFMKEEIGGRDQLGFAEVDLRYAMRCRRMSKYGGGAVALLDYFQKKYDDQPDFCYEIEVDSHNRLTACFWADGNSKKDYQVFNDVVCFDTTYRTNEYDMPFGPFVGVNHHKQTVLLGAGLLFGESQSDFTWLFQTWLDAMGGIPPKAIVTDQDPAIMKVVTNVFPNTHHVLCAWHIHKKFTEKLAAAYQKYSDFKNVWINFIHKTQEVEVFESAWPKLLNDYGLTDNAWLQQMYNLRDKWVPAFTRCIFLAGMSTTQRSESINAFFDHFVGPKTNLLEFIFAYERAVQKRREAEEDADSKSSFGTPVLKTKHAIEAEMAKLYTRELFFEFQAELEVTQYYIARFDKVEGSTEKYNVEKIGESTSKRIVRWCRERQFARCSCRLFDWSGIVCRHIIAVFRWQGITSMPSSHVLQRWTQHPKEHLSLHEYAERYNGSNSAMVRRHVALPKIQFILNELTTNWEMFQIANAGLENIISALWEHKQAELLTDYSQHQQLAIEIVGDRLTSEDSNIVTPSPTNEHFHLQSNDTIKALPNAAESHIIGKEVRAMSSGTNGEKCSASPTILDPHVVKAKGRSSMRMKSSFEKSTERRGRLCRGCKKIVVGHDKRNCPSLH